MKHLIVLSPQKHIQELQTSEIIWRQSCMAAAFETQQHSEVTSFRNAFLSSRLQIGSSKIQQHNLFVGSDQNVALM